MIAKNPFWIGASVALLAACSNGTERQSPVQERERASSVAPLAVDPAPDPTGPRFRARVGTDVRGRSGLGPKPIVTFDLPGAAVLASVQVLLSLSLYLGYRLLFARLTSARKES